MRVLSAVVGTSWLGRPRLLAVAVSIRFAHPQGWWIFFATKKPATFYSTIVGPGAISDARGQSRVANSRDLGVFEFDLRLMRDMA